MNRFVKVGIWVLVGVAAVLPLYELADYTEVWQEDANIVLPAIVFLFVGMALLGANLVVEALVTLVTELSRVCDLFTPDHSPRPILCKHATGPPQTNLILILCDLRL
jgi:hypothetical protein